MTASSQGQVAFAHFAAGPRPPRRGRSPPGLNGDKKKPPPVGITHWWRLFAAGRSVFPCAARAGFRVPGDLFALSLNTISIPHPYDNVKSALVCYCRSQVLYWWLVGGTASRTTAKEPSWTSPTRNTRRTSTRSIPNNGISSERATRIRQIRPSGQPPASVGGFLAPSGLTGTEDR